MLMIVMQVRPMKPELCLLVCRSYLLYINTYMLRDSISLAPFVFALHLLYHAFGVECTIVSPTHTQNTLPNSLDYTIVS